MRIGVVGAGRVGTALAVLLLRAGHEIVAVSGREASLARASEHLPRVPVVTPQEVVTSSEVSLVTVPDDPLADVVSSLVWPAGHWALHCSGALGLDVLAAVVEAGGRRTAMHPLQTVPDVPTAIEQIPGSTAAVTADEEDGFALGERLARDAGMRPFRLAEEDRALYHAAAVLGSNDLVALSALAGDALGAAGVPDPAAALASLQRATVENVARRGPGEALTGPVVRGDAGTVTRNLEALSAARPEAVDAYVVMARATLQLAVSAGRLDEQGRAAVEEALERWS